MPILVVNTAPNIGRKSRSRHDSGFSLLEILIVLALLGLVIGLATPRLAVYSQALQFSKKSQGVIYSLKRQRADAVINKRARWILFEPGSLRAPVGNDVDVRPLELPKGWTGSGPPLYISAAGHCRASPAVILSDPASQRRAVYEILAPDCTAREIKAPLKDSPPEGLTP